MASPRISDDGWGHVTVGDRTFKDAKLWPGGAREWDWGETGTDHDAGVQAADVEELLRHGTAHVVLSLGREARLRVHPDTLAVLDERGVPYDVLPTGEALTRYEELRRDGVPVGALIHSTC